MHRQQIDTVEDEGHFFYAFHSDLGCCQLFFQDGQFFTVATCQHNNRLQAGYSLFGQAFAAKFFIHIVEADLIQFIDGDSYIDDLIRFANDLGNTGQNLTVIHLDANTDTETVEHLIHDLDQFHFIDQ